VNDRISVVLMTRDRRDQTLRTLGKLDELPDRPPVIVVDNGSSDGTAAAIGDAFPSVSVIELGRNLGAQARTVGVRAATTPYVAFSDDDSWWAPESLDRAADHFDKVPRLGLIAARILIGPSERLDPICTEMAASPLREDDLPGPAVLGFIACGAVVRREAYLGAGGFHPVVFFLGEETVLAQDLAAAGWGLAYVDDVVCHHHPQPGPERAGRTQLQLRNWLLSSWLRRPLPIAARDTFTVVRRLPDPVARGALLEAARRLPQVRRHRRTLPPRVERQVRLLEA
jgi:GT2 family glycosyltransferase